MLIIQLIVFCFIFTCMVRISVIGGATNALYFYPKQVQKKAIEIGLTTREEIRLKKKRFMILFYVVMLVTLVCIIGIWNHVNSFWDAYLQALLFLEVMNVCDGIVIDKIWVGYSSFWKIKELGDISYVQTWKQVLIKRSFMSLVWIVGALIVAGIIVIL